MDITCWNCKTVTKLDQAAIADLAQRHAGDAAQEAHQDKDQEEA